MIIFPIKLVGKEMKTNINKNRSRGFYWIKLGEEDKWQIGEFLQENGWIIHSKMQIREIHDYDLFEIDENKIQLTPKKLTYIYENGFDINKEFFQTIIC